MSVPTSAKYTSVKIIMTKMTNMAVNLLPKYDFRDFSNFIFYFAG